MARRPGEGSNGGPGAGTRVKSKPKPRQSRPVGVLAPGAGYSNGRATSPKPSKRVFSVNKRTGKPKAVKVYMPRVSALTLVERVS
jgi:hypothetical protein